MVGRALQTASPVSQLVSGAPVSWPATTESVFASQLADAAVWALIEEAELTPKPALVDARGSGVHPDLSLKVLRRSAHALHPGFLAMAHASFGQVPGRALRESLASIGRKAETAMMNVTAGSNAHRGAIWALGLLLSAIAMAPSESIDEIGRRTGALARLPDRFVPMIPSHGQRVAAMYGVSGARGEAEAGFPHALEICLPALRRARAAGATETVARLDALLAVMAVMNDTCLLHRAGPIALREAQSGANTVLDAGGAGTPAGRLALARLDEKLTALNASAGGAADMLAAALFVDVMQGAPKVECPYLRVIQTEMQPWKS